MLRKTRKGVQYLFLFIIVVIPFLSYLNTLRQAYGIKGFHIASLSGGWFVGKLYSLYELTLGRLDDPVGLVDSFKGTFWSITVFGINISDPLAGLGHLLSTRTVYLPILISISIPIIFTLIFGRAFCGWICPVNTIAEWIDRLRDRVKGLIPWARDCDVGHGVKYWLLVFTLILIAVTGVPLFAYYLPYLVLGREIYNLLLFQAVGVGMALLVLLILFEAFVSRRGWCRYLCPSGALLSLIGSFAVIRLGKSNLPCLDACDDCNRVCPMALEVREGRPGGECTNCGECVVVCPRKSLGFGLSLGRGLAYGCMILVFLGVFFAVPVRAHHIGGLPHYGYTENYPQVPLTEQTEEVGNLVVSLTTVFFQGIKQELSNVPYDTQFYVYIYDKTLEVGSETEGFQNPFDPDAVKEAPGHDKEDPSYRGNLLLTLLDVENKEVGYYRLDAPMEEAVYRFRHYFSSPGDYTVMVEFLPDSRKTTVKFPVSIEVAGGGYRLILVGFAAALVGLCVFLYYRKNRANTLRVG